MLTINKDVILLLSLLLISCSQSEFKSSNGPKAQSPAIQSTPADANPVDGSTPEPPAEAPPSSDPTPTSSATPTSTPASPCVEAPASGGSTTSLKQGSQYKNQYFHRSVAVDPGNTGNDPAGRAPYNLTPYSLSPPAELSTSSFKVTTETFRDLVSAGVTEFEFFIFAHQFGYGRDRITATVKTATTQIADTSSVNAYSAYGYISVKNFRTDGGKVFGDIDIYSFNYDPKGSGALYDKIRSLGASVQDGTGIVGPASQNTTAKVSRKNVDLGGFEATIGIDATTYDSVQYRAIRASVWSPTPVTPKLCQ